MAYLVRGALIEYKSDFLGPVPNIVIFQFNPESLSRTINIPSRSVSQSSGTKPRENSQAGDLPYERISLTAYFSAADRLNIALPTAVAFGVGSQLAALEKMVHPTEDTAGNGGNGGAGTGDAVGNAVAAAGSAKPATQPTPRRKYPNILFIWGASRVLPVLIDSMSINEKQFDARLNPIEAEVSLGLSVMTADLPEEEHIARGAKQYSDKARDAMAAANLADAAVQPFIDLIPF